MMRPMTDKERQLCLALGRCSFLPGSTDKRFIRDMSDKAAQPGPEWSEKQASFLATLAWRYRNQLPRGIRPTVQPRPYGAKPVTRTG